MNEHDFQAFFEYKSYDALCNGNYKKYLTQCKENGDSWAILMHCKQTKIQSAIKHILTKIGAISKTKLGVACRNVTNCAQPPVRMFLGFTTCFVTGMKSDKCLDISKSGKKAQDIHIHCKFAYFFLFLWYICKLEYVIRACAKKWGEDKVRKRSTEINYDLFSMFMQENQDLCRSLFLIFDKAYVYVSNSLDQYHTENKIQPILQPPVSFWGDKELQDGGEKHTVESAAPCHTPKRSRFTL